MLQEWRVRRWELVCLIAIPDLHIASSIASLAWNKSLGFGICGGKTTDGNSTWDYTVGDIYGDEPANCYVSGRYTDDFCTAGRYCEDFVIRTKLILVDLQLRSASASRVRRGEGGITSSELPRLYTASRLRKMAWL